MVFERPIRKEGMEESTEYLQKAVRKAVRAKKDETIEKANEMMEKYSRKVYLEIRRMHKYSGFKMSNAKDKYEKIIKLLKKAGKKSEGKKLEWTNKRRVKRILNDLEENHRPLYEQLKDLRP